MKRIIRLSESDLARIVKRVIREQEETQAPDENSADAEQEINSIDENDPNALQKLESFLKKHVNPINPRDTKRKLERLWKHSKFRKLITRNKTKSQFVNKISTQCPKW